MSNLKNMVRHAFNLHKDTLEMMPENDWKDDVIGCAMALALLEDGNMHMCPMISDHRKELPSFAEFLSKETSRVQMVVFAGETWVTHISPKDYEKGGFTLPRHLPDEEKQEALVVSGMTPEGEHFCMVAPILRSIKEIGKPEEYTTSHMDVSILQGFYEHYRAPESSSNEFKAPLGGTLGLN